MDELIRRAISASVHTGSELVRGTVTGIDDAGNPRVRVGHTDPPVELVCASLATMDAPPLQLHPGDAVLVWRPKGEDQGFVVGRIGPSRAGAASGHIPDELVIEARKSLTLRVGDGSITIREDGKILIKGKDLVSHAKRMNRIKGGSVEIN